MQKEVGPAEVFSCLYVSSFISSQPPFSGLGKYDGMLAQEEADLGGSVWWRCTLLGLLRQGALHERRQVLITRDSAAIPLWKWDFGAVMRLRRDPITVPENHYPISSSVLLISSLHFSIAHTTAFLPSCTLPHTHCTDVNVVYKAKNWKIGQYQIYICICNLKSAHSHICALNDAGVLVKCVILTLSQN